MIDSFGNIPSHPLLVHVPVVLVPLSMVATVLMVLLPSLRRRFGSLAVVILTIAFAGTIIAARSGSSLEKAYTAAGEAIPDVLKQHADMGTRLQFVVGAYLCLTIVWIVRSRRSGADYGDDDRILSQARLITAAIVVLVVTAGSFSSILTLRTAHSGARSVWEQPLSD